MGWALRDVDRSVSTGTILWAGHSGMLIDQYRHETMGWALRHVDRSVSTGTRLWAGHSGMLIDQ
jgi:hypothetical protein